MTVFAGLGATGEADGNSASHSSVLRPLHHPQWTETAW